MSKSKLIGVIVACIAVVVVVVVVVVPSLPGSSGSHGSPEAVVTAFLTAWLHTGDATQVLANLDPQYHERLGESLSELRSLVQRAVDEMHREMEREGFSASFEVGSTQVQNGRAITEVTFKYSYPESGDQEYTIIIDTVRRDGRWYVYEWPE